MARTDGKRGGGVPAGSEARGGVRMTNLDLPLWEGDDLRKRDLVDYYDAVRPVLLPHLRDRPLSVVRVHRSLDDRFMQKDTPSSAPAWVQTEREWAGTAKRNVDYVVCNDQRTLRWLANQRCVELHAALARRDRPDRPTHLILDIDPVEGRFDLAVRVALLVREILASSGLRGLPKTSGGKGVHVYVPLQRRHGFSELRDAARAVAERAEAAEPKLVTAAWKKTERGGRVFLDWTRTGDGATVVSAYSPRARLGAPVSTPVSWERLSRLDPRELTVRTIPKLVSRAGDAWVVADVSAQRLPHELAGRG